MVPTAQTLLEMKVGDSKIFFSQANSEKAFVVLRQAKNEFRLAELQGDWIKSGDAQSIAERVRFGRSVHAQ